MTCCCVAGVTSQHRSTAPPPSSTMASTSLAQKQLDHEQSQLDEILSELLAVGDPMFGMSTSALSKASEGSFLPPSSGSLTTHSGNTRTVVSWQSTQAGPSKKMHLTKTSSSPDSRMDSSMTVEKSESSYSSPYPGEQVRDPLAKLPPNAFTYGSIQGKRSTETKTESSTRRDYRDRGASPTYRDRVGSPTFRDRVGSPTFTHRVGSPPPLRSSPTSPVPSRGMHSSYRPDYEDTHRGYYSDSEPSYSWLAQQQEKLQMKRRDPRSPQEKRLVAELKNAQNSLMRRRVQSEADERAVVAEYAKQDKNVFVQNGPVYSMSSPTAEERAFFKAQSPDSSWSPQYGDNYKAEKSYFVSGVERPPFTTHQTKYTFSVSSPKHRTVQQQQQPEYAQNSYGANVASKPPPSPGPLGRSSAPNSPLIPARGQSSKEAMARSRPKESQHGRMLTRQRSDISHDRDRPVLVGRRHQSQSPPPVRYPYHHHHPQSPPSPLPPSYSELGRHSVPLQRQHQQQQQPRPPSPPSNGVVEEKLVRKTVTPKQTGNRTGGHCNIESVVSASSLPLALTAVAA